jgi:actin-related protein
MYCGDETGSFIGEIGSHTCRFGYGGEDNPKLVVPSYVSDKQHLATSCLSERVASKELSNILRLPSSLSGKDGPLTDPSAFLRQGDSIHDWDNWQVAWHTGMDVLNAKDTMKHTKGGTPYSTTISSTKGGEMKGEGKCIHPVLAVTPGFTQLEGYGANYCASVKREQYTKQTEIMMEQMETSALFLAPSPMLAAFSLGRQTALVVDVGAGGTRVTPVVDGHVLQFSQRRNGRGGEFLGHMTWKALLEEKIPLKSRYQMRNSVSKPKSPLFQNWAMQELMFEVRTDPNVAVELRHAGVPFIQKVSIEATPLSPNLLSSPSFTVAPSTLELPDGTAIDLSTPFGKDLTRIPELLFAENLPFSTAFPQQSDLQTLSSAPIQKLIQESLLAVGDVDARKELVNSICLSGGSSVFQNLDARLSQELSEILPGFVKPKVIASRNTVERQCAAWIGASILTSLGSFQQLWLSRTEYEEYGAIMGIQRFP